MPPPIVPAPITPTRLMSRGLVSSGRPSILAALRSAKKKYCWARAWVPVISSMNSRRSSMHAFGIGLGDRRLDRLDVRFGRVEALELAGIGLAELVEDRRVGARFGELVVALAGFGDRADVADLLGEGDRMLLELALDQPVDQADVAGLLGADRIAGRGHFQRLADAGDARQPLRAAGAGQQAELDLGHAELRRRHRDPVMAGQRDLEAAAERGAVDRGDHRLGAILDDVDHLRAASAAASACRIR